MLRRSIILAIWTTTLLATVGLPICRAATIIVQPSISKFTQSTAISKPTIVSFPGARAFTLQVPSTYTKSKSSPLIIALHGYTSTGAELEKFLQLAPVAQARGILYVAPDGSLDNNGIQFWNATPACCNFFGSKVDDEAYIMSIVYSVSNRYNVDQKRIYIIGHSNGGFMAHHMACADSSRIAAVASFAGATYMDQSSCKPTQPITILQIWGTADETISYQGGAIFAPYPGAIETISDWAKLDKCRSKLITAGAKINIDASIPGAETTLSNYSGCAKKTVVELWSIVGGSHVPMLAPDFATRLVNFLLAHPKA